MEQFLSCYRSAFWWHCDRQVQAQGFLNILEDLREFEGYIRAREPTSGYAPGAMDYRIGTLSRLGKIFSARKFCPMIRWGVSCSQKVLKFWWNVNRYRTGKKVRHRTVCPFRGHFEINSSARIHLALKEPHSPKSVKEKLSIGKSSLESIKYSP